MVLSNYKVGAGLAVSDMDRARGFYEGKLGLRVSIDSAENVQSKASYQLASDDRRKKWLFCFAMDMNLHNRDLTQHNS